MIDGADGEVPTAASRLRERGAQIAALESGRDVWLAGAAPAEQLGCLHGPLLTDPTRVGLVIVPDTEHPLCRAARAPGRPVAAIAIAPDMDEAARRDLGIALRGHRVQLLFVTPERLTQPRFVAFVRAQSLAYVAVASCQRMAENDPDHFAPYGVCRALRGLFPEVPLAALADRAPSASDQSALMQGLGLDIADEVKGATVLAANKVSTGVAAGDEPVSAVQKNPSIPIYSAIARDDAVRIACSSKADYTASTLQGLPDKIDINKVASDTKRYIATKEDNAWQPAFPLLKEEMSLEDVAAALGQDNAWCVRALEHFIRTSGRTTPFPWVAQPDYLTVAMVAGQAESLDPRVVLPLLRERVSETTARLVLAALGNRPRPGGRGG